MFTANQIAIFAMSTRTYLTLFSFPIQIYGILTLWWHGYALHNNSFDILVERLRTPTYHVCGSYFCVGLVIIDRCFIQK